MAEQDTLRVKVGQAELLGGVIMDDHTEQAKIAEEAGAVA